VRDERRPSTKNQDIPGASKLGLLVMAVGFLYDLVEHTVVVHTAEQTIGAFPLSEHVAHLIVIVGMVLVLAGIVIQGSHRSIRRDRLAHGRNLDAIR
jgi:hypothetical protein